MNTRPSKEEEAKQKRDESEQEKVEEKLKGADSGKRREVAHSHMDAQLARV